jgi:hypothetical protein
MSARIDQKYEYKIVFRALEEANRLHNRAVTVKEILNCLTEDEFIHLNSVYPKRSVRQLITFFTAYENLIKLTSAIRRKI